MLVTLKLGSPPSEAPKDALGLLLECHERIRRHAAIALRIARAHDAPPDQVADAARQVGRYFGVALPLHVADEDESLAPRLDARGGASSDQAHVREMIAQHVEIERLLGRLLPRWEAIAASPEDRGLLAPLEEDTAALDALLARHLELEETHLFPRAREVLPKGELDAIAREIRARRGV